MNNNLPNSKQNSTNMPVNPQGLTGGKEREFLSGSGHEKIGEVPVEVEIPQEVEKAGVTVVSEKIELPPDIKNLGVSSHTPPVSSVQPVTLPKVELPISDQQVVLGLHQNVTNAIAWIAMWCVRKLHKAHIVLKVVHGKIIRVKG
jgi:hypothetical protein